MKAYNTGSIDLLVANSWGYFLGYVAKIESNKIYIINKLIDKCD